MKRIELLFSELNEEASQKRKQRLFGFIVGGILLLAFAYLFWKKGESNWILLSSGISILILSIVFPKILEYFLFVWLLIGKLLGEISSRVILSILYLLIAFPISLFRKKKAVGGWKEKKVEENDYEKMY